MSLAGRRAVISSHGVTEQLLPENKELILRRTRETLFYLQNRNKLKGNDVFNKFNLILLKRGEAITMETRLTQENKNPQLPQLLKQWLT